MLRLNSLQGLLRHFENITYLKMAISFERVGEFPQHPAFVLFKDSSWHE